MTAIFPTHERDVTAPLLSEILGRSHPGTRVAGVEVTAVKRCGEGIASTADRIALRLDYTDNPAEIPATMVLKTMLASPHAPAEMFETEVHFYDKIRPSLSIETPRCFGTGFDRPSGQFGLLLEDLAERGARFPDATQTVSVEQIRSVLAQLARLHAAFWRSERFETDLAWVATPRVGGMSPLLDQIGRDLIVDQLDRHPVKRELLQPLSASFDELWAGLLDSRTVLDAAPVTLLHGDTHLGNTYLLPDGGGLLDWQLQVRGCWAHDVIYLIATGLPIEVRRSHGRALVEGYVAELRRHGVDDAPDGDEAWEWCRRAVIWGLVIGWLICPPANYGIDITVANIERMVAAVNDLDALDAIRKGPPR